MDLDSKIDAAYQEAELIEAGARQIEARIIAAGGRPLLRQYGKALIQQQLNKI